MLVVLVVRLEQLEWLALLERIVLLIMFALVERLVVQLVNFGFVEVPFNRQLVEQLVMQCYIGLPYLWLVVEVVANLVWCFLS